MGQKVNPNIFQLGINKEWDVKFSEITNEEHTKTLPPKTTHHQ